jgi:hypothetical protein
MLLSCRRKWQPFENRNVNFPNFFLKNNVKFKVELSQNLLYLFKREDF